MNRALMSRTGYRVVRADGGTPAASFPGDYDAEAVEIIQRVQPYTMTSPEKLFGLVEAVRHVARSGVPGSFVECGVWRGGSSMAMALALLACGVGDRDLYLFDTFEGMPPPGEQDVRGDGVSAASLMAQSTRDENSHMWCIAQIDAVRDAVVGTGYPAERVHLIQGMVEETTPGQAPDVIALLRLDTDWYESTRHELEHLVPRVSSGGILVLDDYGWWQGARRAVDEWNERRTPPLFFTRLDEGRIALVP